MNWGLRSRLDRAMPGLPNDTGSVTFTYDHGCYKRTALGIETLQKNRK